MAGVVAFFLIRGPGPAGKLGDDIADSLGCGGGTEITEETKRETPQAPRIFSVTCDGGHLNPVGTLYRFEGGRALKRFLASSEFGKRRICVTESDAFDDAIEGVPDFEEFCSEHGGAIH